MSLSTYFQAKMSWEKRNATVVATLSGLQPGKRYKGSIAAVDEEGVTGLASRPFISATGMNFLNIFFELCSYDRPATTPRYAVF